VRDEFRDDFHNIIPLPEEVRDDFENIIPKNSRTTLMVSQVEGPSIQECKKSAGINLVMAMVMLRQQIITWKV